MEQRSPAQGAQVLAEQAQAGADALGQVRHLAGVEGRIGVLAHKRLRESEELGHSRASSTRLWLVLQVGEVVRSTKVRRYG